MQQPRPRSGIIFGLLSLGLLVGAALTSSPAQAATGPGPYYAEPAWSQKLAPAKRFVVLTDWFSEAVLDKETGLVWERARLRTVEPGVQGQTTPASPASLEPSAAGKAGGCRLLPS